MSQNEDERPPGQSHHLQAGAHQPRADPLTLEVGQYSQRRQAHSYDTFLFGVDDGRRKQDMTHEAVIFYGDPRYKFGTDFSQDVDDISLRCLAESSDVNGADLFCVAWSFFPYADCRLRFYS
jgi:hypothetical protein